MVSRSIRNILVHDEESSSSGSEYETDTQADEDDTINDNSTMDELEKIENLVNQEFAAPSSSQTKPQTGKGGEDQDFTTSTTVGSCSDDDINTDEDIHTDDDDDGIFGRLFGGSKNNGNDEIESMEPRDVTAGPSDAEKELSSDPTSRMIYLPMEISGDRNMDPAEAIRRAVRDLLNNAKPSPMVQAQETEMDRLIRNEIQEQLRQREAFYAHGARKNMIIMNDNSAGSSGGSSKRYLASSSPKSHHKRTSEKSSHRRSSTHRRSTLGEEREKSVHRKDFNSMSTHAASNVNKSMSTHTSRNVSKQVEEVVPEAPVSPRRKSKSSHRRSIQPESDSDNDAISNSMGKSSHRRSSHRKSSRRGSGATLDSIGSSSQKRGERDRHGHRMSNSSGKEKSSHRRSSNKRSSHRRESSSRSLDSNSSNTQSDSSLCSSKRRDRYRDESMRLEQVVESPSPSQHKKELEQPPVLMQDLSTTSSMTSGGSSSSPRKYTQLSSLLFQKIQDSGNSPEVLSPMLSPGRDRAKSMHMRSSVPLPMAISPMSGSTSSTRERQLPMRNRSFGDNESKNQQATTMPISVPMKKNMKPKSKNSIMDESDHSNNATIGKGYSSKDQDDDPSSASTIISMNTIDEDMPSLAPIEVTKPRKETKTSSDGSTSLAANLKNLDAVSSDKDILHLKKTSLESGSFHSNLSCKDLGRAHSVSSLLSTEMKDLSRGNSLSSLLSFEKKTRDSEKDPKKEASKERERGRASTLKEASEKSTRGARSKSRRSSKRTSGRSKSKSRRPSRTVEESAGDRDEGAASGKSRHVSRTAGDYADKETTNGKSRPACRTVGGDADRVASSGKSRPASRTSGGDAYREATRGKSSRASRTTGGDADREATTRGKSSRASRTTGGDKDKETTKSKSTRASRTTGGNEDTDTKKMEKSKEKEKERRSKSDRKSERKGRRSTSTATATTSTTIATNKTDSQQQRQERKSSSKNATMDVDTSLVSMLSTGSVYASPVTGDASPMTDGKRSKRKDKFNKSQLPHLQDDLDNETATRRQAESSKKPTSPSKKKKMKKLDKRESKKILVEAFSDMPSLH